MSYRWWLITSISLFIIGILFGVLTYNRVPASVGTETGDIQRLSEFLVSLPKPLMLVGIFAKNTFAVAASIILSPILLVVPALTLLINGWIIGLIAGAVVHEQSLAYLLAGLLPHGIFELPALFMGEALAFKIGIMVIRSLWKEQPGLKISIAHDLRLVAPIVILFLVAAVIETYVTPAAIQLAI